MEPRYANKNHSLDIDVSVQGDQEQGHHSYQNSVRISIWQVSQIYASAVIVVRIYFHTF